MVDKNHKNISIRKQCLLLTVTRSNVYYDKKPSQDDFGLANEIHEIWLSMPMYGYRKITKELQRRNYDVNHKRVLRIMRDLRIMAIYPKPKTTVINKEHTKYPYLLRDLKITGKNHVWATYITYVKLPQGFVYLIAIIDVFSRFILSQIVSTTLETEPCIEALDLALNKWGKPDILNTDQGSQFTSREWISKIEEIKVKVSMDGVGRWADNIFIERFWRTIKHECILLYSLKNVKEARKIINDFIQLYNFKRLHQSLNYTTPAENYLENH